MAITDNASPDAATAESATSEFRLRLLQVVSAIGAGFTSGEADGLDAAIGETLTWLGTDVGVDRAYLFRLVDGGRHWESVGEWCAGGIAPSLAPGEQLLVADMPWAFERHRQASVFYLADCDNLPPQAWRESQRWQQQGLKSTLVAWLRDGEELVGLLGLDTLRAPKAWEGDDIALLRSLASIIEQAWHRQRAEAALREAMHETEAANRLKSEFLAAVSHEVRTPLNGVLGMAQLLAETAVDAEQAEWIAAIQGAGTRLLTIFNGILDLAAIEAGTLRLSPGTCDPVALIEAVAADFAPRARELNARLTHCVHDGAPRALRTDGARIQQILTNLLDNALKFAPGSDIRVTLAPATAEGREWLRFAVTDSGPGVPAAAAELIFESFRQADGSSTRRAGGLGIGLTICRDLVALFGGRIGLEPVPSGGASFWFTIPLVPAR